MIKSELHRERIENLIDTWAKNIKIKQYLRDGDIYSLVDVILSEFYHVTLSCGHKVNSMEDGVHLEFYEYDDHSKSTISGSYCKDCAKKYKKALGAWEVK